MERVVLSLRDEFKPSPELERISKLMSQTTKNLIDNLSKQIDEAIVVGLSLRGFKFEDESELKDFLSKRCTKRDHLNVDSSISEMYVDGDLFMSVVVRTEMDYMNSKIETKHKVIYH